MIACKPVTGNADNGILSIDNGTFLGQLPTISHHLSARGKYFAAIWILISVVFSVTDQEIIRLTKYGGFSFPTMNGKTSELLLNIEDE